tara:strand:+ start:448 stop:912 length:465 start_codon:yes stop_codon:yes gene_type:complete
MIAVVQRVNKASVIVKDKGYESSIRHGLCVLLGVESSDQRSDAIWMANKIANLRVFSDQKSKMNLSVKDTSGEILLISQFTLAGNCIKGNRPSFTDAAEPALALPLIEQVENELKQIQKIETKIGLFGEMMDVEIHNNGPVTLIIKSMTKENEH